jgi:hypothetical protein
VAIVSKNSPTVAARSTASVNIIADTGGVQFMHNAPFVAIGGSRLTTNMRGNYQSAGALVESAASLAIAQKQRIAKCHQQTIAKILNSSRLPVLRASTENWKKRHSPGIVAG